jgi:hypothetical protein
MEATAMSRILFNFGRNNHLALAVVVSNEDLSRQVAYWLNGRMFGRYVSVQIPWHRRLR